MKAGISTSSTKKAKKKAPIKKIDAVELKEEAPKSVVIDHYDKLMQAVVTAKNNDCDEVLVTTDVLKHILGHNYKNDSYMLYHNVKIYDVDKVDASKKEDMMSIQEKVFGHSTLKIGNNAVMANGAQ